MNTYTENEIKTLEWNEHIRRRPGMYIGKLGDGSSPDDGIYVLLKEVMDNSVDEYAMGYGKQIVISISDKVVTVRDYGRGIPLDSLIVAASKMNTGAKYDNKAFKKSVGLNGVGIKAVNALSIDFKIQSYRDGESQMARFSKGILTEQERVLTSEKNGTLVTFLADEELFGNYIFNYEFIETMLRNYSYLNSGLLIKFDGKEFISKNGLLDLLNETLVKEPLYPPIYLKGDDIEIAITHGNDYGEGISSFVNGQFTTQGGTHLSAFREAVSKTIKDFYKRDFDPADVRQGMIAAVSIKVQDPVFESQTKTKLGSKEMGPGGVTVRNFIGDFLKEKLDNYLHRHPDTADAILKKILDSEKERKAISGIQKLARERAKKANLHNRKLRDCRIHYTDKHERSLESTLFITEGDSASGSITKSRDVMTQAVFSLRGKPQNSYGLSKKIVYENEEFNLLQAALNIEDDIENLRYNKIVMATDADVDGMHIRMLLLAFFLQFFPDLVRQGHLYILQTPLFRVRNKKETTYCYSDEEREKAIKKLGPNPEITRFKGLGEISPDEFRNFIGETIRLDRVRLGNDDNIPELLEFYMGKNTPDRQNFVRANLRNEVV
ncbi:MAG: type IIA DNA topoisomerase subunit B [Bacteroidales bacterium]|nr:type IIA DNA topoisomerase subunit B [Bacteroidales bacterium]WRQ32734.1 DNA topoisomerase IV subunit B [Bacteroidales bacterium MB20-C3-3]MBP6454590.1 type IIA DNA topoisomerase subunit B [Bacteroidales bacterium]MBP8678045.1 type IIA DNA topoisomerase subunit B [Bacteroidales bacterium]MBP9584905.1 type IIA DNA topoisomerase subunit B [Bacteroidales bacterium]